MGKNNRVKIMGLAVCLTAFFFGGWLLGRIGNPASEVKELYRTDGESIGIFNQIPTEDMEKAEQVAAASLNEEIILPEDKVVVRKDGRDLPSQIVLTDLSEIAGVAPKESEENTSPEDSPKTPAPLDLQLTGSEVASVAPQTLPTGPMAEDSQISLIAAPVTYFLIKNTDEYKAFKKRARGGYPEVDFNKQALIVLESDSNLPDNVFELVTSEEKDGVLEVTYRVNVFRLDKKINSHTVLPIAKTQKPVELKQVL